jgi:uncharacterized UBP type Zn finger protein
VVLLFVAVMSITWHDQFGDFDIDFEENNNGILFCICNLSTSYLHFLKTSFVCRVLERSLAEDTKLGTKRKRSDMWFVDPLNPHERKRLEGWPVGLKNVGNTCWFSAVIQVRIYLSEIKS